MKKLLHFLLFCALAAGCFYLGGIAADRQVLSDQWVRIHVVGASDDPADQAVKLQVRNRLLEALETKLLDADSEKAWDALEAELPQLQELTRQTLAESGSTDAAKVTLERETFPQRRGDGFRLPAGVYRTLRVTIGEGRGHNWWGVLFPQTWEEESVSTSLTEEEPKIRFFFLEKLGELENWLEARKNPLLGEGGRAKP